MKELTTKERLQVFMLYPNAILYHHIYGERTFMSVTYLIGSGSFRSNEWKILLKSLEEITEEDKRELLPLLGITDNQTNITRITVDYLGVEFHEEKFTTVFEWSELPYPAADFLRSNSYAIPFKGVDLFDAGIAVRQ